MSPADYLFHFPKGKMSVRVSVVYTPRWILKCKRLWMRKAGGLPRGHDPTGTSLYVWNNWIDNTILQYAASGCTKLYYFALIIRRCVRNSSPFTRRKNKECWKSTDDNLKIADFENKFECSIGCLKHFFEWSIFSVKFTEFDLLGERTFCHKFTANKHPENSFCALGISTPRITVIFYNNCWLQVMVYYCSVLLRETHSCLISLYSLQYAREFHWNFHFYSIFCIAIDHRKRLFYLVTFTINVTVFVRGTFDLKTLCTEGLHWTHKQYKIGDFDWTNLNL